jgi:hypothetical protein
MAGNPVAKRILELKGEMSYQSLERAILEKTGKRIAANTLCHIVTGTGDQARRGRPKTIAILAEFAGRPESWFYTTDEPETPEQTATARADYLTPTGDPLKDQIRRDMLALLDADGESSASNLQILASIVEMMAKDAKKTKKGRNT